MMRLLARTFEAILSSKAELSHMLYFETISDYVWLQTKFCSPILILHAGLPSLNT